MPGYSDVVPVEPLKPGLLCLECKLLLRDPVQTDEGDRLCRSCYDAIKRTGVSAGGITLGAEEACYPDRAVGKEIKLLRVKCSNHTSGCPWQGTLADLEGHECKYQPQLCSNDGCGKLIAKSDLKNHEKNKCAFRVVTCRHCHRKTVFNRLEAHYAECTEYPVKCDRCSESVKKSSMEDHKDYRCLYVECLCGEQLLRTDLKAHLSKAEAPLTHVKPMLAVHQAVIKAQKHSKVEVEGEAARVQGFPGSMQSQEHDLVQPESPPMQTQGWKPRREKMQQRFAHFNQGYATAHTSAGFQNEVSKDDEQHRVAQQFDQSSRLIAVEKKMEELKRQNAMIKVHVSELELQLQASLASTHNGTLLWGIPDVGRKQRDAIENRITSIYSPPFYTGRNGYKMCIRAYLNGDGIGFKTHLSLFFVLMRGEYDPLLKWPFEHKVSLILVDQDHRKHIVQTFKPTPESSSFKRPTSDMNVVSGCPQFSKVDVLDEKNYVKDDIMYIKCIVDVSRIFHP